MDRSIMPGRSVASAVLLLLLHGLLCLQLAALAEIEMDDDVVMADGSCMHFSVSPPAAPPEDADERRDYFRAMAAKDLFRHEQIIAMMGSSDRNGSSRRRQAKESSKLPEVMSATSMFELPMRSALNIAHVGMYLVSVRFGTPALPYNLVLDTANDLTWINCRLRRRKGKHYGRQSTAAGETMSVGDGAAAAAAAKKKEARKNWYRPAKSSSWRRIRCSQQECAVLPYNTCQSPSKAESCSYFQRTQDGTVTIGIYGKEKATVTVSDGRLAKLPGLVLGCSVLEAGGSVDAHDGVLSLGNGDMSFAIHAIKRFGGRFSFCLLSANSSREASSYLTFGPNPAVMGPGTMETDIMYNVDVKPAYGPQVTGIFVGGERLDIPEALWNVESFVGAGIIMDTSTSVTSLVPEAYGPVTAALDRHLAHLPRVYDMQGFEYCYSWTFTGDGVDPANNVTIPKFTVEMVGGARLEPEAKSVVMPEVQPGVACLAFTKLLRGGPGIFGNVLMQEYIWEIDHGKGKMRFRKDKCNTHHLHTSTGGEITSNNNTTASTGGGSGSSSTTCNGTSDSPSSSSTVVHRVN